MQWSFMKDEMTYSKNELELLLDGIGWLLDQTNDESDIGNMNWKNALKLQAKIRKELK